MFHKNIQAILLISAFFYASILSAQDTNGWVFKNEKEGVKVYYRKTSNVYELKLITSLKVSLSGLVSLLSEVDKYPKWGYKVAESRELKKVSDWEMYYYSRLDFPWPLDDRDVVIHSYMHQDAKTKKVVANSYAEGGSGSVPFQKGVVRMTNAHTTWTMIPGPGGWTYVEYYIYSDPGGNIPDWLVNMALDVGPRETIKNIRKYIRQDYYQNVKLGFLQD